MSSINPSDNDIKILLARSGVPCKSVNQTVDKDIIKFDSELDAEIFQGVLQSLQLRVQEKAASKEAGLIEAAQYNHEVKGTEIEAAPHTLEKFIERSKDIPFEHLADLKKALEVSQQEGVPLHKEWGQRGISKQYGKFTVTEITDPEYQQHVKQQEKKNWAEALDRSTTLSPHGSKDRKL